MTLVSSDAQLRIPLLVRVLLSLAAALLLLLASRDDVAAGDPLAELIEVVPVEASDVEEASSPAIGAVSDLVEPVVEDAAPITAPIAPITAPLIGLIESELSVPRIPVGKDSIPAVARPAIVGVAIIDKRPEAAPPGIADAPDRARSAEAPPPEPPPMGVERAEIAPFGGDRAGRLPSPTESSGLPILSDGGLAAVAGMSAGVSFTALMALIGLVMADPIRRTGLQLVPPVPPG